MPSDKRPRYWATAERGIATVEAVIAVPLFVFLVFMAMEFMLLSWRNLSLQFVATQVVRNVATGQCWKDAGKTESVVCSDANRRVNYAIDQAKRLSSAFGLGAAPRLEVCISTVGAPVGDCRGGAGVTTAGSLIEVKTTYQSPLLFGLMRMANLGGRLNGVGVGAKSALFSLEGRALGRIEGRERK